MMITLLLILLAAFFGGTYYAYKMAFLAPPDCGRNMPDTSHDDYAVYKDMLDEMIQTLHERPFEEVMIRSHDGLKLVGSYYHSADGAPLVIGFHGYKSAYLADFCGISDLVLSQGHNLLLIDQRAHGRSEGKSICFGIQERKDLLAWVRYAIDRFGSDTKILLYGVSMGGATVLMASGMALPENVRGIIADCPYAVASDIIADVGKKMRFPEGFTRPFGTLAARIYGGFNLNETDAIRAVEKTKVPILIIHGEADTFVPAAMSEVVHKANPKMVRRVTFPGAGHAMSYLVDTKRYRDTVQSFIEEVLS